MSRRITQLIIIAAFTWKQGWGQLSDNTPPVVWMERRWDVSDTEAVGAVVTRVKASDEEGDPLSYGLERHSGFNIAAVPDPRPLPFTINPTTGVVYTNESLADRGGENLYLFVTVSDGKLTHKSEVWVNIRNTSDSSSGSRQSGLNLPPQFRTPVLPPGLGNGRPQPNIPFGMFPFGFQQNKPPPPPGHPRNTSLNPIIKPQRTTYLIPADNTSSNTSPEDTSNNSLSTSTSTPNTSTNVPASFPPSTVNIVPSTVTIPPANVTIPTSSELAFTAVLLVMFFFILLLSVIITCLFRKRICNKKIKNKKDDMQKESGLSLEQPMAMQHWRRPRAFSNRYEPWETETTQTQVPQQPKVDEWEFPRHHLKVFNILGEGCFGQVWRCEALDIDGVEGPSVVAVKTLKENAGEGERSDLLLELQVMKMFEPHPNVVRLLGCCTEKDPLFVIMEYISHGKLQAFLRNSRAQRCYDNMHGKSNTLTSRDLTSFCYQVARGMAFLSAKGIIHRDLAARNILVDSNHICKVADFGFARDVVTSHVYERKSEGRLPIRWMAPESLYDNMFSVKSDIWSFGVLVWEIVTLGSTPYPGLAAAEVMRKVRDGYRMDKPEHCRREVYNIMYYCWDRDPQERPNFTELVDLLEQLLLSETDYIELERFPDHSYYNMVSLSGEKL